MRRFLLWLLRFFRSKIEEAEQAEKRDERSWDKSADRFKDAADRWRRK